MTQKLKSGTDTLLKVIVILIIATVVALSYRYINLDGRSTYYFGQNWRGSDGVEILFVGDIMLDRNVAKNAEKIGMEKLLGEVSSIFRGNDLVMGNLEGTITTNESIARKNNEILRFTFDPKFIDMLVDHNFTAVSLANNHALDFYRAGYDETRRRLDAAGIASFGHPNNAEDLSDIVMVDGKSLCFVGYHDLYTYDEMPVLEEIRKIKPKCHHLTVFPHWGDEYEPEPNQRQIYLAHRFIDAGADLIIGAHPHVVQTLEIYKGKPVFYSLGNFMFDQYFSFETTHGIAIKTRVEGKKARFEIIPVEIDNGKVTFAQAENAKRTISALIGENMPLDIVRSITDEWSFAI